MNFYLQDNEPVETPEEETKTAETPEVPKEEVTE